MTLLLSSADLLALQPVLRLLTAPLDSPSMSEWRTSVLATLAPLFGADAGVFVLSEEGKQGTDLLNLPMEYLVEYAAHQAVDVAIDLMASDEIAFTTTSITRGDRRIYTETDIYSSLYRHHNIEDGVWTTFSGPAEPPNLIGDQKYAPRGLSVQGTLVFYANNQGRPRFGVEGIALMKLLHPLMQSAGQIWVDTAARRAGMAGALDEAPEGLALMAEDGSVLHLNPALNRLLAKESQPGTLMEAARELAVGYSGSRNGIVLEIERAVAPSERKVKSGSDVYSLRSTSVEKLLGMTGVTLVSIKPYTQNGLSDEALRHRYGLTKTEVLVARHLSLGTDSAGVAALLNISIHTVRRHSERIRQKMGVSSQRELMALFMSDLEEGG